MAERLLNRNIIVTGPLSVRALRDLYTHCSLAVLNSVADGYGLVVPQALAMGLPVVCTTHVGAKDLIIDGYNGYVVPPYDI